MATKSYGDRARRSYAELADMEAERIARHFGNEYDEPYGVEGVDEDAIRLGTAEAALTMGTAFAGDAWGGARAGLTLGDHEDPLGYAVAQIEEGQRQATYMPRTEAGRNALSMIGDTVEKLMYPLQKLGDGYEHVAGKVDPSGVIAGIPYAASVALLEAGPGPGGDARKVSRYARQAEKYAEDLRHQQPELVDRPAAKIETPGAKVGSMDRRVGTTGKYRGAPRDVTSPQKLAAMRKRLKDSLDRGVIGRDWYERSSQAADELTAGREGLRTRYTGAIGVTSADTAVPSNAGFAIKGYNQLAAGDQVHTGRYPQRMSESINAIANNQTWQASDKVGPFIEGNNVTMLDPDVRANIRPTNDLWMARAFGYTQKDPKTGKFVEWSSGLGEAQHRFMDEEMSALVEYANKNKVGGFDDWTPEKVQAAIWVDTKARREGTSVEQAATDFATDLDSRTVNITSESTPAQSLNHMPGIYNDADRAQSAFEAQNIALTDEGGRNVLATGANALTRPQVEGRGVYQGESNPVAVNRILGSTSTGTNVLDPSSRKLAETVGSIEGMVKGQESVGYNFLRQPKKAGERNAAVGPNRDMAEVQNQLDAEFDGEVIATPSEEGIRYLYVGEGYLSPAQQKTLMGIVDPDAKKIGDIDWRTNSGDLVGSMGDYKPSEYLKTIDDTVAGNMDAQTRYAARALEELDDALAQDYPDAGPRNAILQKTRKALSEGGIGRVRELVEQGVLPAVVLAVIGAGSAAGGEPGRGGET